MNKIISSFIQLSFIIVLAACSKPTENQPTVDPPPTAPNPADTIVKGSLFVSLNTKVSHVNTENGNLVWQDNNVFGTAAFSYDSGYLYAGTYRNLRCYNASTGQRMWTFSWLVYSDVTGFSRYAFTDSLMFVTAPSSAWDQGQLFCLNKRTGALKWTNELDTIGWSSDAGGLYFSLPVVSNGKVIVVTRDYNKHRRLVAYNVLTGKKVWGTGINDDLKFNIKVDNGKIYSVGKTTFCYDANTGAQLWQKDINIIYTSSAIENGALVLNNSAAYVGPLSYIDQNKLIIAGKDSLFSAVTNVKVLDKNTGAILSSQVYNLEFAYYMYGNNTIYIGNYVSGFFLNAYDLNTGAFKWKYATTVSYPPILTDKNIIYSKREGTYFLNLDGKMVRLLPHPAPSTYVDVYLFKDASNNVFTQRIN